MTLPLNLKEHFTISIPFCELMWYSSKLDQIINPPFTLKAMGGFQLPLIQLQELNRCGMIFDDAQELIR